MFAEGSVYAPPGDDDGARCLVMRQWPRGVAYQRVDVWLKELGPTAELLRALDSGHVHWGDFSTAYLQGLQARPEARKALAQLRDLEARSGKVTLLCHEREFPCHRFLLLDYLKRTAATRGP